MKKKLLFIFILFLLRSLMYSQALSIQAGIKKTNIISINSITQKNTISYANRAVSTGIAGRRRVLVSWGSNIKGEVGEAIVEKILLPTTIDQRQRWTLISPRYASQGIDHIAVRWKNDRPAGILVAETKVNTSVQGNTRYGYQMSDEWINYHLHDLKVNYGNASVAENVTINSKVPRKAITCKTHIRKPNSGDYELLWSSDGGKTWNYTGKVGDINLAQYHCRLQSQYFDGCANGQIKYKRKLYRVDLNSRKIYDSELNSKGAVIPNTTRELPLSVKEYGEKIRSIYAQYLQKVYKMSPLEAKIISKFGKLENIANGKIKIGFIKFLHGTYQLVSAALVSVGINIVMQLILNRENFSLKSVGFSAVIGVVGTALSYGIKSLGSFIVANAAKNAVKTVAKAISSLPGINLVVGVLMALGGYWLGFYGKLELAIQIGTVIIQTGLIIAGKAIGTAIGLAIAAHVVAATTATAATAGGAATAATIGAAYGAAGGVIGAAAGVVIGIVIGFVVYPVINKIISDHEKKENLKFVRNYYLDNEKICLETQIVNRKYFN